MTTWKMSDTSNRSETSAMEAVVNDVESAWRKANPNKFISAAPAVEAHRYLVKSLTQWSPGSSDLLTTPVDFIPAVTIDGLPTNRYPEYLPLLFAATVACLRIEQPSMALALESDTFQKMIAVAVAARAGFWAAVNWTPKCTPTLPSMAIVYDKKRRNVWLSAANGTVEHDRWLAMMSMKTYAIRNIIRELHHTAIVAPVCAVAGASLRTAVGAVYAFDLVMERVILVLDTRLHANITESLGVQMDEFIELVTMGPLVGAPVLAARVWASDPLVAVGAQRRIAVTKSERHSLDRREALLSSGKATPASTRLSDDAGLPDSDDPMLELARITQEMPVDAAPEPTVLNGDSGRGMSEDTAPEASVDIETRTMAAADRAFIQEVARHAQQSAPPAPSILNGADTDEPAVW
jgi:hypothetical protein